MVELVSRTAVLLSVDEDMLEEDMRLLGELELLLEQGPSAISPVGFGAFSPIRSVPTGQSM
jgi:hypothetical protein